MVIVSIFSAIFHDRYHIIQKRYVYLYLFFCSNIVDERSPIEIDVDDDDDDNDDDNDKKDCIDIIDLTADDDYIQEPPLKRLKDY